MRNFPKFIFTINFLNLLLIAVEAAAIIFLCLYLPACLPVAGAFVFVWIISLITAIFAAGSEGSPEIKCALTLIIIALPVAGALIYAFSKIRRKPCGCLTVLNAKPQSGFEAAAMECCGVSGAGYDKAVYINDGEEYFNLLFREIEKAEQCVYLEYFIVSRGTVFARLVSALRKAKSNGAEIKIIIDGIGSAFKSGRREFKKLKALGAEVRIFHRLIPLLCMRLNFRDHRKIAVIDGKTAFTGGFNIGDEYANIKSPYGHWKDCAVAVYGAAAEVFGGMFLSVWNGRHEMTVAEGGKMRCLPYYDSPPVRAGFCENAYASAINAAKYRVHIFTPYFCAGEKLASALKFAAMRGVDVRVIIPHKPDKKYAYELSKASCIPLAERGVKFFEYTPGFMHAKSLICDDVAFIGTYNFDYRSMRLNYECGVAFGGEICERAERDFWDCLRLSSPVVQGKRSKLNAIKCFILKLFAPLM